YTMSSDMTYDPGINFYFTATDGQLFSSDPLIDPSNNPYSMAVLPNELPVISHDPVYTAEYDADLLISCQVTDETDYPEIVKLNYRTHGGNPVFTTVEMTEMGKGVYAASIPGSSINENGTDYYITARDNYGVVARFPVEENYVKMNQGVGIAENQTEVAQVSVAPNPFNQETSIAIEMRETGKLLIELYDVTGKKLKKLTDTEMEAGVHHFTLRKGALPEGIYLLKVKAANAVGSQKIIIR
ncbi:MAG TPA: T9SS type A sorting domain-containing protein, partial [Bacteroidales bacterium]|nr:T9SS type A sorting domain-containing protein [Bacteroidales bacterium]